MNRTDLLSLTVAENACRRVEYHENIFSAADLVRISRIIEGTKPYNELYDICPLEVDGTVISDADDLILTGTETLVRHPSGTITQEDYRIMKKLVLYRIPLSAISTAAD